MSFSGTDMLLALMFRENGGGRKVLHKMALARSPFPSAFVKFHKMTFARTPRGVSRQRHRIAHPPPQARARASVIVCPPPQVRARASVIV